MSKNKTQQELLAEDFILRMLKNKFLSLCKQETVGKTPEITKEIDDILVTIREMERENIDNINQL